MLSGPRLIDGRELRQSRSRALPESGSDEAELRYMVDGHPTPAREDDALGGPCLEAVLDVSDKKEGRPPERPSVAKPRGVRGD